MATKDDVPVEQLKELEVTGDEELTPGYKAPAKVDLETLKQMDADDKSLQKYKQDLLGSEDQLDEGGLNVLVKKLSIMRKDMDPIELDLTIADLTKLQKIVVRIKEGAEYYLKITFRVQREIVSGLRFHNVISRKGINVDKNSHMVGSYGPNKDAYEFLTPPEEAPKGIVARGHYNTKSKFIDDDKNIYLEWQWKFDIAKDW